MCEVLGKAENKTKEPCFIPLSSFTLQINHPENHKCNQQANGWNCGEQDRCVNVVVVVIVVVVVVAAAAAVLLLQQQQQQQQHANAWQNS